MRSDLRAGQRRKGKDVVRAENAGKATLVENRWGLRGRIKSRPLSPSHRFVIAMHSPVGVIETGLLICPSEKTAAKPGSSVEQDTFSGPV